MGLGESDVATPGAPATPGRLPDFVIAGMPKAGTTSLARWLGEHPDGWMAPAKELRYFNVHHDRGEAWYREQFAAAPEGTVAGEATPLYVVQDEATVRMAEALPDARFVVTVREPVARAWSHFWFWRQLGVEARSWDEAIEREVGGTAGPGEVRYLHIGAHAPRIRRLLDLAGPERVQVHLFDDLRADGAGVLAATCAFVGLDPAQAGEPTRSHNVTLMPRSARLQRALQRSGAIARRGLAHRIARWNLQERPYPAIDAAAADRLRSRFGEMNADLEVVLGRPVPDGWWPGGRR